MAKRKGARKPGGSGTPKLQRAPWSKTRVAVTVAIIGALGMIGAAAVTVALQPTPDSDVLLQYSAEIEKSGQLVGQQLRELREFDTLARFENLHTQNLRAIKDADLLRSNQLTREINDLLEPIRRRHGTVRYLARVSAAIVRGAAAVVAAIPAVIMSPFDGGGVRGSPTKK